MKIWLIQNILAPYRIPLFAKIAASPGVDFSLVLLSRGMKNLSRWQFNLDELPFKTLPLYGRSIHTNYDNQISLSPRLSRCLWQQRPDVVIGAGYSLATMQLWLHKQGTTMPYVLWMEGTQRTESGRTSTMRCWQRRIMTRSAAAIVDAGVESHEYVRSLLRPGDAQPAFFRSYNCVETDRIRAIADHCRSGADAEWNRWRAGYPKHLLVFAGQLIARKGVHELLAAFREVRAARPDTGLLLLGVGDQEAILTEEVAREGDQHVYFEGFIDQDDYPRYLAAADVAVIPSLFDPNPLVLFECMAAGLPVVGSPFAGNSRDFIQADYGAIVDPNQTQALAQALLHWLAEAAKHRDRLTAQVRAAIQPANYDASAAAFVQACQHALQPDSVA